jgi:hypothetical protein
MVPEGSLLQLQKPAICPYPEPDDKLTPVFYLKKSILSIKSFGLS